MAREGDGVLFVSLNADWCSSSVTAVLYSISWCIGPCYNITQLYYCQTSNINCTLVGNKSFAHLDVVGASPVGAAPATSSFLLNTWQQLFEQRQLQDEMRNI